MTLFWMIVHIHTLIYIVIYQLSPYYISCTYAPGIYTVFVNYYQLVVRGIFATSLMLIFGLITVKNIRTTHRIKPVKILIVTSIPVANRPQYLSQKDRQFILMVFIDIIIYILCSIARPIYMVYSEATQYQTMSAEGQAVESFFDSLRIKLKYPHTLHELVATSNCVLFGGSSTFVINITESTAITIDAFIKIYML